MEAIGGIVHVYQTWPLFFNTEKNVRSVALTSALIVHWMAMLNIILAPLNCCFKIMNKNKLIVGVLFCFEDQS